MDESLKDRPSFFGRLKGVWGGQEEAEPTDTVEADENGEPATPAINYRYTITGRKTITSEDDMYAAANGIKRGEGQVLNLQDTEPVLREKIKHFLSGILYYEDGTWEEVAENVFIMLPAHAYLEMAPTAPSTRMVAAKN